MKEIVTETLTTDDEVGGVDQLPVVVACDVGSLETPAGDVFGVLRVLWSTAADYDEGSNDQITTLILPTTHTIEVLIQDLQTILPTLTETKEV